MFVNFEIIKFRCLFDQIAKLFVNRVSCSIYSSLLVCRFNSWFNLEDKGFGHKNGTQISLEKLERTISQTKT